MTDDPVDVAFDVVEPDETECSSPKEDTSSVDSCDRTATKPRSRPLMDAGIRLFNCGQGTLERRTNQREGERREALLSMKEEDGDWI